MGRLLTLTRADIDAWDKYERIGFYNQISGVRTPFLLGTSNSAGTSNLAIFNSVVHLGASPPLLGFIMRPTTVERHTYENIKQNKLLSMNLIHEGIIEKAHATSGKYSKEESEFEKVGLTAAYHSKSAPYVKESNLVIQLTFVEEHELINGTRLMVCEINEVLINSDQWIDGTEISFETLDAVAVSGLNQYYKLRKFRRLDRV